MNEVLVSSSVETVFVSMGLLTHQNLQLRSLYTAAQQRRMELLSWSNELKSCGTQARSPLRVNNGV